MGEKGSSNYPPFLLPCFSGFRAFNNDLRHFSRMDNLSHLQEMEFTSTEWQGGGAGHPYFRAWYQKYKEGYVKGLRFDSDNLDSESFGKLPHTKYKLRKCSRCSGRVFSVGGSIHLFWHSDLWWDRKGRQGKVCTKLIFSNSYKKMF